MISGFHSNCIFILYHTNKTFDIPLMYLLLCSGQFLSSTVPHQPYPLSGMIQMIDQSGKQPAKKSQKISRSSSAARSMPQVQSTTTEDTEGGFCRKCGKFFQDVTRLRSHERYHERSGRYPCRFCGKTFASTSDIRRHERIHTGEKPYKCSTCGRCFAILANLKSHEVHVHFTEGKNKFRCSICLSFFTTNDDRLEHEMSHHGNTLGDPQ